jgi:mxaJ protein
MQRMSQAFIALVIVLIKSADPLPADRNKPSEPGPASRRVLRVAADPSNLPFSNRAQAGFENELATLIASELDVDVEYHWRSQRRGFFRETLGQNKCDLVLGVPTQSTECLTTKPYYRSTYVWMSRLKDGSSPTSLQVVEQAKSRIGVQLLGDGAISPPAHALIERGLSDRLSAYSLYAERSAEAPALLSALNNGEIDIALAWGPLAGSFARQPKSGLMLIPLRPEDFAGYPVQFDISLGVRRADVALRDELDRVLVQKRSEIDALLDRFGVPRVEPARDPEKSP